ncbi:tetratricopeptide repeat protein [Xanthobacter sp. V4C-4]|uniref:O-linked N-acetylglucosamine transferase, SPINDLY family protein n=1 Tax=Xanthobacter cornucopiae TaxID=3119924 RepID=UPI003728A244
MKTLQDSLKAAELHKAGKFADAAAAYAGVLQREPNNPHAKHMMALCLSRIGRLPEAAKALREAARSLPGDADIAGSLGNVLAQMGEREEAQASFERALAIKPGHRAAQAGLSQLAAADGRLDVLRRAVAEDPDNGEAALALGCALIATGSDPGLAVEEWSQAVGRGALTVERLAEMSRQAYAQLRDREAILLLQTAASLRPTDAALFGSLGALLLDKQRYNEALDAVRRALALDPADVNSWTNLGTIYVDIRKFTDALACYRKAMALAPDNILVRVSFSKVARAVCEWSEVELREAETARLLTRTGAMAGLRIDPFSPLSSHMTPADHLRFARNYAASLRVLPQHVCPPAPPANPGRRIRVGYFSRDYHHHATAFLAVEMFERHDREKFEVFAYSYGPNDNSDMRRRVVGAFDHFVEVAGMSNEDVARRIHDDGIDILVDLKGYTANCRTEVMAMRPAPVQVNFLGFPGSMGASFIDYIIGDRVVTPLADAANYDEKIVQLPGSYQPNDSRRLMSDVVPSRADCGLPETGIVFCCFNNTYKITPDMFRLWMRLLDQVPDSVLWLYEANATARDNLAYEAASAGVDPDRLIFAPWADVKDHLARQVHADLFLDTRPYNAHTTASDALWAGVPVVTFPGESFASRVAASLLHAVGLPELVTSSLEEYEALALALARDPERVATLKSRLLRMRAGAALFDAAAYTRGIEAAYLRMHALRVAGRPPEPIVI